MSHLFISPTLDYLASNTKNWYENNIVGTTRKVHSIVTTVVNGELVTVCTWV